MQKTTTASPADRRDDGGHQAARAVRPAVWIGVAGVLSGALLLTPGLVLAQDFMPVRDREGRFTISVPSTWRVTQPGGDMPALSAFSPDTTETPPDSVAVFLRDTPFPVSPEFCVRQAGGVMRTSIGTWTTLSEGPDTLGGLPAYSRVFTWRTSTGEERRSVLTCVPVGRRVFVIVGTTASSADGAAKTSPELIRIMGTFRPVPGQPSQVLDTGTHR
jgi:hypothetical protein